MSRRNSAKFMVLLIPMDMKMKSLFNKRPAAWARSNRELELRRDKTHFPVEVRGLRRDPIFHSMEYCFIECYAGKTKIRNMHIK